MRPGVRPGEVETRGSAGGVGAGAGGRDRGGPRLSSFCAGDSRWICGAGGGRGAGSGAAGSGGRGEGGRLAGAGSVLGRARAGGWNHDGGSAAGGGGRGGDGGIHSCGSGSRSRFNAVCSPVRTLFRVGRKRARDNCCSIADGGWTMRASRLQRRSARAVCRFSASRAWPCFRPATKWWRLTRRRGPAQIRNSNSYSLAAQIQNAGGEPVRLAIAPDEPEAAAGADRRRI